MPLPKTIIILIFCVFLLPSLCLEQKNIPKKVTRRSVLVDTMSQVKLTTKIIGKSYCSSSNQSKDILRLNLVLKYINISTTESVILYKYSNSVRRVMVSKQLSDIQTHNYEYNASQTTVTDGKKLHFDDPLPGNFFAILKPGNSVQTKAEIWIEVARTAKPKDSALTSGEHYLQIKVSTWDEADISPEELKDRWREQGTLWFAPLESIPLRFNINQKRTVQSTCNP